MRHLSHTQGLSKKRTNIRKKNVFNKLFLHQVRIKKAEHLLFGHPYILILCWVSKFNSNH
jgi:hypothetical protein